MTELVRDAAIVLRATAYSETSLIVTAFTARHGRIGLMAKGARRRIKNGSTLVLEPGYEMEFVWAHKSSRDLQLVRELSLLNPHFGIRQSLEATVIASSAIQLLLRTQNDDDPHPALFLAATQLLGACESPVSARWPVYWKFHLVLLSQLGFAVGDPSEFTKAPFKLSGESLALIRKLNNADFAIAARLRTTATAEREVTRWLALYLSEHLHISAQPRSLEALRWVRR